MTQTAQEREPVEGKITSIARKSLSDEVAEQIVQLIANGHLTPGSRLPSERELQKQFGVGRSSLREALRCLAIVGVIDVRVGDGTFVAESGKRFMGKMVEWRVMTERHDIENLLEVRLALESDSAALAALRGSDEDRTRIEQMLESMPSASDSEAFARLDLELHLTIARASKNELFYDLLMTIRAQLHRALQSVVGIPGGRELAHEQHCGIVDAIRRRDSDLAKQRMRAHIQAALERYRANVRAVSP